MPICRLHLKLLASNNGSQNLSPMLRVRCKCVWNKTIRALSLMVLNSLLNQQFGCFERRAKHAACRPLGTDRTFFEGCSSITRDNC